MKTKKKRLLFVTPNLNGGGAQLLLLHLLKHLSRDKFEVGLFIFRNEGKAHYFESVPSDVTIKSVFDYDAPQLRTRYELLIIFSKLIVFASRYDVVVGSLELMPTFMSYLIATLLGKRCVGWVHTSLEPYLKHGNHSKRSYSLTRFVYPRLDEVVFVSEGARSSLESVLGTRKMRSGKIIYNILDYPRQESQSTKYHWDIADKVVVSAGRLVSNKAFDLLIKAHANLIKENVMHKLVILGEGPLRGELEMLAYDLGVSSSVFFEGFVSNPSDYFRRATLFVLSTRFEGFGLVIVEAMMEGTPVISTDCPYGPAEILEGGKYGLLVPPEDVDSLAQCIKDLLLDVSLQNHLRQVGPLRAADFLPDKIVPQWEQLFETI